MTKVYWLAGIVLVLVAALMTVVSGGGTKQTPIAVEPKTTSDVTVDLPLPNSTISSPVTITGSAKGGWYFEASFPIEVLDTGGAVVGSGIATAQGDWMVDTMVPFSATVTFTPQPVGSTGGLRLKKDNPSGLPVNDASVTIPIIF